MPSPESDRKRHRRRSWSREAKKEKKDKKAKKEKKRRRHSSSPDSEDSLDRRLADERLRVKAERRAAKEAAKAAETPEEKRARRLAKKLAKDARNKEELGWGREYLGYSNVDNPFNDPRLTQTFHWGKKLEAEGLTERPKEELERKQREKVMEAKAELEGFKRARAEREAMREDMERMRRDEEMAQHHQWLKAEDVFHLKQARQRSRIRMRERRAKPIDFLTRYAHPEEAEESEEEAAEAELDLEMHDPFHYIQGLSERDLEDLLADIGVIRKLERTNLNTDYWADVEAVAEEELRLLKAAESGGERRRGGINDAVRAEVLAQFKAKSYEQLGLMETGVRAKIKSGAAGTDVTYWEEMLELLRLHMARCRLSLRHEDYLKDQAAALAKAQGVEVKGSDTPSPGPPPPPVAKPTADPAADVAGPSSRAAAATAALKPNTQLPWAKLTEAEREERRAGDYEAGGYSPVYLKEEEVPAAVNVLEPDQDAVNLKVARAEARSGEAGAEDRLEAEVRAGMGSNEDEAGFAVEATTAPRSYLWSDKYKPRKPRYFNRVHTGFEWNKYNQTHYDLDNPPPKIVQGYKFNIFYPDLLDPNVPPEFKLYPCDDPDFAILKFTAGPPYEDIAFKVVCREWEQDARRGYRCQFQNAVFQLWFHFKRWRYRR